MEKNQDGRAKGDGDKSQKRVAANSSVNFAHLTEKEQVQRYKNMLQQYNELKKKVIRVEQETQEKYEPPLHRPERTQQEKAFVAAQRKLKQETFEIPDSNQLMENLTSLLAKKKMKGDSIEFGMVASIVRKVTKKLKRGEKNFVGKTERRYFNVTSKEGLIEFFTGMRLDQDEELRTSALGHESKLNQRPTPYGGGFQVPKTSELDMHSIQSSFNFPAQSHANADTKLNAAMLRQFNRDHPHICKWV